MKVVDMTCPKCGASLKLDSEKKNADGPILYVCDYCCHHILIEQEETIEEIRAKAQSKSYGYHMGKIKAEEEAVKKKKYRNIKIAAVVICIILFIALIPSALAELLKPMINPFDYVEVSFKGKDGEGKAVIDVINVSEDIDANRIEFDISKTDYLSEGNTISIRAESDDYRLTQRTKTYKVEGLDEYLKDLDAISEEALENIHIKSEAVLEFNLDRSKSTQVFIDMRPVKLFLTTDGKQSNTLYDVFEAHFAVENGEKTYYVMVYFDNVVLRQGTQQIWDMSGGMYSGDLIQVEGSLFISGYSSLEEVRADILTNQKRDMELKELDLR